MEPFDSGANLQHILDRIDRHNAVSSSFRPRGAADQRDQLATQHLPTHGRASLDDVIYYISPYGSCGPQGCAGGYIPPLGGTGANGNRSPNASDGTTPSANMTVQRPYTRM